MLRLTLHDGSGAWAPKDQLQRLNLFSRQPKLLENEEYAIKSDVRADILDFFLSRVFGTKSSAQVTQENAAPLKALCDELGFTGFDAELSIVMSTNVPREFLHLRDRVDRHDVLLEELRRQIFELARHVEIQSKKASDDEKVEGKLERVCHECQRHQDEAIAGVRKEISLMAEVVESLSDEVSSLKKNERRRETEQHQASPPPQPPPPPPPPPPQTSAPLGTPQSSATRELRKIEIPYEGQSLNGIIAYLTRQCGGNVHEKGAVTVTASNKGGDAEPKDIVDLGTDSYFYTINEENSWVCYDFKDRGVIPTGYAIKSYQAAPGGHHLQSWVLEVSKDQKTWEVADQHTNTKELNNRGVVCYMKTTRGIHEPYRFVRLRQIGQNHRGRNFLFLSALELFGTLTSK